jgi:hypothetical protein
VIAIVWRKARRLLAKRSTVHSYSVFASEHQIKSTPKKRVQKPRNLLNSNKNGKPKVRIEQASRKLSQG